MKVTILAGLLQRLPNGATPLAAAGGPGRDGIVQDEVDTRRQRIADGILARAGVLTGAEATAARQDNPAAHQPLHVLAEQSLMVRPVYERFIAMAVVSGELVLPPGVTLASAAGADYLPPPMPWINPVHEMQGITMAVRGGVKSLSRVIAERGDRMYDTLEQIAIERRWADEIGIVLDTDPRHVSESGVRQTREGGDSQPAFSGDPSSTEVNA